MFKNYLFNCNKLNENKIIVNLVYGTYHKTNFIITSDKLFLPYEP
jgi:hypothetical protein